jgi:hypothetical protein
MKLAKSLFGILMSVVNTAYSAELDEHASQKPDPFTGKGFSIGNAIYMQMNYQAAFGSSTVDPASLAVGHHDPDRRGITQQNIEFSLGARFSKSVSAFATYAAKVDRDDRLEDEFEEYYLSVAGFPWGMTLKGGRFFPRFGYHQDLHPHDFEFVDQFLAHGRYFGEDSLALDGAQVTLPVLRWLPIGWEDCLRLAYGAVPSSHEAETSSEPAPFQSGIDGEAAGFEHWALTADYTLRLTASSTSRFEAGASLAFGPNGLGRHTQIYGAHCDAFWRPDGVIQAPHDGETSKFFRWRTEAFVRHASAVAQDRHSAGFTDAGLYTFLTYGFPGGRFQAHLRGEYVSGVGEASLSERWRISPAVTWFPSAQLPFHLKLQYNFDHFPATGDEHSIWAQFSFTWGDEYGHSH